MEAVILIFKHATFLHLRGYDQMNALTQAELNYQQANIDLKIQQYLRASSKKQSVNLFSEFIMAIDIGLFILASVKIISHQFYLEFYHLIQTQRQLSHTQVWTQTFWRILNH